MIDLLSPWTLRNAEPDGHDRPFMGEDHMAIDTASGWEICECSPITDRWTPEEIARIRAMRAAPDMLAALRQIRKLCYDAPFEKTKEAVLKCSGIAEEAIRLAETSTADSRAATKE